MTGRLPRSWARRWAQRTDGMVAGALVAALAACGVADEPPTRTSVSVTIIDDCADPCPTVELRTVATVGHPDDAVLPRMMTQLAAGPGYIAAGLLAEEGVVGIYDAEDGSLLEVLGRPGGGPGEFDLPFVFAGPGRTVWVVDIGNQRITELGPGGEPVRAIPFTGAIHQVVPLDSARVVAGGVLGTALDSMAPGQDGRSPPYHVITRDGDVVRSFGRWHRPGTAAPARFTVGTGGGSGIRLTDGRVFQLGAQTYTILEWTDGGEPVRRYDRAADWFPPDPDGPTDPNRPWLIDARVDRDGRIWTVVLLTTGRYEDAFGPDGRYSVASFDRVRDAVIEVLDPAAGRVVARTRLPQAEVRFLPGSDLLWTVRQDSVGYVYFDLHEPTIPEDRTGL